MLESIALIPSVTLSIIAFGFGVIIGSFLNVFIYRFHTGKSLAGSFSPEDRPPEIYWTLFCLATGKVSQSNISLSKSDLIVK